VTDVWLLPLLGLCIGGTVTLLGGGGGVFYFLALVTVVDLPYRVAVPTSLAAVVLTTVFGTYGHHREGNVAVRTGALLVLGAVAGTYLGARTVGSLPTALLRRALGVVLLVVAGLGGLDPVVALAFGAGAAVGGGLAPRLLAGVPTDRLEAVSGPLFAGLSGLAGLGFLFGVL